MAGLAFLSTAKATLAQNFGQQEIPQQNRLIAVAAPVGNGSSHKLVIFEQLSDQRPCWQESGGNPTIVNPLLLTFDFTGICNRSIDSNGFSIRMASQDLGLTYDLAVVHTSNDLILVGRDPFNRRAPVVEVARSNGLTTDFAKLNLNPGWRFTRRIFNGQVLGHIYLTNDRSFTEVAGAPPTPTPTTPTPTQPTPTPPAAFPDIVGDIYRNEIEQAIARSFVGGFPEDGTFRPLAPLTREQLVSLVLESLSKIPNVNLPIPSRAGGNPYPDVAVDRWSAAKIQFARDTNIVSGYQDGTFRPTQTVTRAELMAVLRRASEYGKVLRRLSSNLTPRSNAITFADTSTHWAAPVISQMSGYCKVASPYNEAGNAFLPDQPAQRNYATAATLRMLQCVESEPS